MTANLDTDDVSILLADGNASWLPELRFGSEDGADTVVATDLNGDGRVDLAVLNVFARPFGGRPPRNLSVLFQ